MQYDTAKGRMTLLRKTRASHAAASRAAASRAAASLAEAIIVKARPTEISDQFCVTKVKK